jgi:hypothetical protein
MSSVLTALAAGLLLLPTRAAMAVDNLPPGQAPEAHVKSPTTAELRKAIEHSLPFIEKGSDAWITNRGCISCHVVAFSIWSNREAKQKGFAVDQKKVDRWVAFAHGESPDLKPVLRITKQNVTDLKADGVPETVLTKLKPIEDKRFQFQQMFADKLATLLSADEVKQEEPRIMKRISREGPAIDADTYGQLLIGGATERNLDKDWAKKLTAAIIAKQQPDGLWSAGGQLPGLNRPRPESNEATTMWVVLALFADPEAREASADARSRALAALKNTKPGVTNESLILHLMIAHQFGEPGEVQALLKELRDQQHPDGGWSWLRDKGPSDAFATGQTLYALRQIGEPRTSAAIQHAEEFLLTTQQKDGSWQVASQGPGTVVGWSLWGTTWATIGLLQTLPE